ncbi:MAG: type II toxin-antitoxin system MqsA family antitoxin [Acidobacteria bacterium]|nr:MAG: type II toxin-antitoxin system MqsA family antitoxin [Acidobacteriota bacterium]
MKNSRKSSSLTCDLCAGRGVKIRYVTRSYGKGAKLLLIENAPVVSCPNCGESYVTAETLHELERIKTHRRSLAKKKNIPIASFPRSA